MHNEEFVPYLKQYVTILYLSDFCTKYGGYYPIITVAEQSKFLGFETVLWKALEYIPLILIQITHKSFKSVKGSWLSEKM